MTPPELSVVIPAFNEAARLPATLERVASFLSARGESYEILVVDDGSTDGTAERALECGEPSVRVLRNDPNRGKGYSVRRGMLEARGARRLMTDADLSTPIEELPRLAALMEQGFDVVIASRAVRGARIEVRQPLFREAMGRLFNAVVQVVALPGIHDTQCGFKLFTARAAEAAFSPARLDGFSFDVEALFIARRRGLKIAEMGVTWRNDSATRVSLLHGARAFLDLLKLRANEWQGRYLSGER